MGVPKFYRWISERYPCLSEIIKDYQIPEFDNLYLDMNGIIHNCSHPNDNDPHFRISEEQIFKDIFHYIEVLFRMIQPRKIFFMAIDGVAPRAKMNQQRGRRFRSAREAEENEKKAREKGEELPTEERFDSNCITPGTHFMAKLDAQLQYFVTSKISSDSLWQQCTVIYSGHQTPGEGEHKIMEYIRYTKSQPNYDSNTRHCLYGLDADLIMLGLTSHEPHFSLLREEVRFGGKKDTKRTTTPEETCFHLLHLSLMREYLEYEFYDLKTALPFQFDIDSVIDDWVFMGFLVGNDFIPNLPGLHINKDALPILYEIYKEVMPSLDGYLNEGGTLNLRRFEKFMDRLTFFDIDQFREINDDMKYLKSKRVAREANQRMRNMEAFDFGEEDANDNTFGCLEDCDLTDEDVAQKLASLGIEQEDASESEDESEDEETQFEAEFRQHKRHYYMTKLNISEVSKDAINKQIYHYIRGLQWILNYYYNGICSWSWYYPYHYAPYISDIKDFVNVDMVFEKGQPFLPFEQLLGVLPPNSVKLLPLAYHRLMLSDNSPIIDYYPKEFSTDLNGKLQEWEAVVLIPFIDENRLLEAMRLYSHDLSPEEKNRNQHGPMYIYQYTPEILGEYKAPNYFPPVCINHAILKLVWREEWDIHPLNLVKGLLPGTRQDVYFAGFPTLKHVKHTFRKGKESVKVFQQPSRSENYILEVRTTEKPLLENIVNSLIGKEVFVSWPHLVEAKVVAVCNSKERYIISSNNEAPYHEELDKMQSDYFTLQVSELGKRLHNRWGIDIIDNQVLVFAKPMSGRSYVAGHGGKMTLEKIWSDLDQPFPFQTIVRDIALNDSGFKQYKTVEEVFTRGSKVFMLGHPYYGCVGEVMEINPQHKGRIRISLTCPVEPNIDDIFYNWKKYSTRYMTASECSSRLAISTHLFSRITGTIFMSLSLEFYPSQNNDKGKNRMNIALNLKNNKKNEEVVGFSRRCSKTGQWLYSDECIKAVNEYQQLFPEVFDYFMKSGGKDDMFQDDIFPDNYEEKVPELTKWLANAPFATAQRCPCGSMFLDSEVVAKIAEQVDKVSTLRAKSLKMQAMPALLYKPNVLQGSAPPDPTVTFKLFDRVINVREGFSVPLAARGTIIGTQPAEKEADKLYDILFDEAFTGGLTLAGPPSAYRCYRLHWATMINLTHGERKRSVKNGPSRNASTQLDTNPQQNREKRKILSKPYVVSSQSSSAQSSNYKSDKFIGKNSGFANLTPEVNINEKIRQITQLISSDDVFSNQDEIASQNNIPAPPNPSELPQPCSFRKLLTDAQKVKESTSKPKMTIFNQQPSSLIPEFKETTKGNAREIRNEGDVPFVLHGNFYSNWRSIKEMGIKSGGRDYIPCVSYIPPKIGNRTYQIHIYLNVAKLLHDNFKLLLLSEGQVMCFINSSGYLHPTYIEKVIDNENMAVIYSSIPTPQKFYPSNIYNVQNNGQATGIGRGKILTRESAHPKPKQLYESIWTQMNDLQYSSNQLPERTTFNSPPGNRNERKEVSVSQLFECASLERLNLPKPLLPVPVATELASTPSTNCASFQNLNPNNSSSLQNLTPNRFVPTQVTRNQTTPKKPSSNVAECSDNVALQSESSKKSDKESNAVPYGHRPSGKGTTPKPKKKPRCRLAANLGPVGNI